MYYLKVCIHPILLFITINFCIAQDQISELVTDRPDQTESSVVVPHKTLQLETGFVLESKESDEQKHKNYALNTSLFRYGLLENTELRLGFEYLKEDHLVKANDSSIIRNGFGPLYTGFKTYIVEEKGILPEIAFLGAMVLPFSANKDFKPEYPAANLRFAFSHTLTEKLSLGYNLGAEWDGESAIPAYFYSVALGIGLTDKLGFYVESYGLIPHDTDIKEHLLDGGLTYLILPNFQLDLSGGVGLGDDTIDNFFSFGFSYRFPK